VFAATMIMVGGLGLIKGDFSPILSPVPEKVPARIALVYLCALILLVSGLGMLWKRTAAVASRLLLAFFLIWLLLLRLPNVLLAPNIETVWAVSKTAVMAASAWVLYIWFDATGSGWRFPLATGDKGLRIARVLYGLALIPFGFAHFMYLERTASLVPPWLPAHLAWARFTGLAFIAAGVAALVGVYARLAVVLSAWEVGMFTLLVWVPIIAKHPSAFDWVEFEVSCTLTAGAWVMAECYRNVPWFRRLPQD